VADYMKAGCFGVGMSDFREDNPAGAYYHNGRTGLEMHNLYTLLYHKATYTMRPCRKALITGR